MNASNDEITAIGNNRTPEHVDRLRAVLNLCRRMRASTDLASLQALITREAKELLQAVRISVFLFDRENCELWSAISQEGKIMRFDARLGIAGAVAMTGQTINVAEAYQHPLFYKEVDIQTDYRTSTLLAVPIHSLDGAVIGVGEATNKFGGLFTQEDAEILSTLAAHLSDVIEPSPIAAEIRAQYPSVVAEPNAPWGDGFATQKIVGMSHRIQSIIRLIDQIRPTSVDVLIQGGSGTGKELIAKALHFNSPRAKHSFVPLNCAALPDDLVETELFGIEKGVATGVDRRIGKFESAHGGTLFLDEIGDLSLAAQAKILRVLQEHTIDRVGGRAQVPVDVRIVAATNRDLETAMREKLFREDLYYRLSVVRIQTPALRDIPDDIPILANHFLQKHCSANRLELKQFSEAAMASMAQYSWPGNARQLENETRRLVASVRNNLIGVEHLILEPHNHQTPATTAPEPLSGRGQTLNQAIDDFQRKMIEKALDRHDGNKVKAAQDLGLSRQGLIKKLRRLRVE